MASKVVQCGLFLVFTMMLCSGARAQSGCTRVLVSLSPCLNYVTGNSSTPSSSCCSQLAKVVQSQPQCLCTMVNGDGSSLGVSVNKTLALGLPAACDVKTPPVSRCNGANSPTTAPASSPLSPPADETPQGTPVSPPADETPQGTPFSPPADETPQGTPSGTTAGTGSKAVPTAGGTSDASITRMQLYLTLFLVLAASSAARL